MTYYISWFEKYASVKIDQFIFLMRLKFKIHIIRWTVFTNIEDWNFYFDLRHIPYFYMIYAVSILIFKIFLNNLLGFLNE